MKYNNGLLTRNNKIINWSNNNIFINKIKFVEINIYKKKQIFISKSLKRLQNQLIALNFLKNNSSRNYKSEFYNNMKNCF